MTVDEFIHALLYLRDCQPSMRKAEVILGGHGSFSHIQIPVDRAHQIVLLSE